ncbi:MAG: aminoglycoside phosphotransferase family protein [Agriterribacter sp.]
MTSKTFLKDITSAASVENMMRSFAPEKNIRVNHISTFTIDNSASILMALAEAGTQNPYGHFGLDVTYSEDGKERKRKMVMKVKPHGDTMVNLVNSLSVACGEKLNSVYRNYKTLTGFQQTHLREQEIYTKLKPAIAPNIYGVVTDASENVFAVLMEYLDDVLLLNSVMQLELWTDEYIKATLKQLAEWHAFTMNNNIELEKALFNDMPSLRSMTHLMPALHALLDNAASYFPGLYTEENVKTGKKIIGSVPEYWQQLEQLPKAFIHNDCNPRNICFKKVADQQRLCIYDWELATFHIPQYDVAEFLCFVLDEDRYHLRKEYVAYYRGILHAHTGRHPDATKFYNEFLLAANDFGIQRLGLYMMAHKVSPYPFIPRVVKSFFDTVRN